MSVGAAMLGGVSPLLCPAIFAALEDGPLFLPNPHGFEVGPGRGGLPVRAALRARRDLAGDFALPVIMLAPEGPVSTTLEPPPAG